MDISTVQAKSKKVSASAAAREHGEQDALDSLERSKRAMKEKARRWSEDQIELFLERATVDNACKRCRDAGVYVTISPEDREALIVGLVEAFEEMSA